MKLTVVTCDNCRNRLPRVPRGKRPRIAGQPVDLCGLCLAGSPPVDLDAPLAEWPRFVPSAALAPLLELANRASGRSGLVHSGLPDDLRDLVRPVVAASESDAVAGHV